MIYVYCKANLQHPDTCVLNDCYGMKLLKAHETGSAQNIYNQVFSRDVLLHIYVLLSPGTSVINKPVIFVLVGAISTTS